jgi:dTMP kinase
MPTDRPRYIAFEGIEGCGKSTQASRLAQTLSAVLTRETGGTAIGARVREVLHDPANTNLSPIAEALLIAGDRAQHRAEVLAPVLGDGHHVVSDRSVYSSLAYQGYGRGLDLPMLRTVNDWALDSRWPDLVILLDMEHDVAMARLASRSLDRFEQETSDFFARIRNGFLAMAADEKHRWVVLDANRSEDDIEASVRRAVLDRLGI